MDLKTLFETALDNIYERSAFATAHTNVELPPPTLSIQDHGPVKLPLSRNDAQAIIDKARKSAFGKGTQTHIDENVRRSWELDSDQFTLQNPQWQHSMTRMMFDVQKELGIPWNRGHLQPQLYKLLLYEEGAFFKLHQDSEKTPGMFGTLVVALPSSHRGGMLSLKHRGEAYTFDSSSGSESSFSWAAWYVGIWSNEPRRKLRSHANMLQVLGRIP
jgi:hypothetical protein